MELEIHPIQTKILLVLLFKPKARYSDLNITKMTTDHFNFHVQRLVEIGLIGKGDKGYYKLTTKGKEFANRFDTDNVEIEKQAKVSVVVICTKKEKGTLKILLQQRLKQPYFGYYGFISGKIRWGETLKEAAKRELKEETNLTSGKLTFSGINHKMDYDKGGEMLEDKFFYVFRAENIKGKLMKKYSGGKNIWLTEKEIGNLPEIFGDIFELIEMIKDKKINFLEKKYKEKRY